jgi:hypothetical protein
LWDAVLYWQLIEHPTYHFECSVAGIRAGRAARHEMRQQHLGATARNMRLSAQRNKRNIYIYIYIYIYTVKFTFKRDVILSILSFTLIDVLTGVHLAIAGIYPSAL